LIQNSAKSGDFGPENRHFLGRKSPKFADSGAGIGKIARESPENAVFVRAGVFALPMDELMPSDDGGNSVCVKNICKKSVFLTIKQWDFMHF
jgi:hypothetical protein